MIELRWFFSRIAVARGQEIPELQYREPVVRGDDSPKWKTVPVIWEEDLEDDNTQGG